MIVTKSHPKRKYSKNGCLECKRKKTKCDESKPACWNCSRLGKNCSYQLKSNQGLIKSSTVNQNSELPKISSDPQQTPENSSFIENELGLSLADANFLFNDLNDVVNMRLDEIMTPLFKSHMEGTSTPFDPYISPNDESMILDTKSMTLNEFDLEEPHTTYLLWFYDSFSMLMSPLNPSQTFNPVRDMLLKFAKKETHLLYCVLACGAKASQRKTSQLKDSEAYYHYLSMCVSELNKYITHKNVTPQKIESMLLTLLLLIGDCASSKDLKWRSHLYGAKRLLCRSEFQSDAMSFCRNWFTLFEILAGVTNNKGGTFDSKNEHEMDELMRDESFYLTSLRSLQMIDNKGFNYVSGHIIHLDMIYMDIIKVLNRIRSLKAKGVIEKNHPLIHHDIRPPVVNLEKITKWLTELEKLLQIKINEDTTFHSSSLSKSHYNTEPIEMKVLNNGQKITLSLFDMTHQTHTICAQLVILHEILQIPTESYLIQEVVQKGLSHIRFLEQCDDFDNICITHLHFPMSQIAKLCIDRKDQILIEKFMNIVHSMGLHSAGPNLVKLKRLWNNEKLNDEDEEDFLTW